jgi:HPt (histidine-containing phosphotransfer) domain-containing protein
MAVKVTSLQNWDINKITIVLTAYCKDVRERPGTLQKMLEDDNLPLFVINVHALKSTSASIGATEISTEAAGLEEAGNHNDKNYVSDQFRDEK